MKILAIIFFLGLTACINSEKCPKSARLEPCFCSRKLDGNILVKCHGEDLDVNHLNNSFNSLIGKKNVEIEFENAEIGTIPSNLFAGIEVVRLEIYFCALDGLTEDESRPPLLGLEDSLEILRIVHSFSEANVPAKLKLDHLRKLRKLDLTSNTITEMGNEWFGKGSASLESVIVSKNGIEKIGDRVFANLSKLKTLVINGNRFGNINRPMLPTSADALTVLAMNNNAIERLPEDIFSNMPKLSTVDLGSNGITRLEQNTWEPVWEQLKSISLEQNPLECDSHMTWLFALKTTNDISGRCEAPKDKRGTSLGYFIRNKRQ